MWGATENNETVHSETINLWGAGIKDHQGSMTYGSYRFWSVEVC